MIVVRQLKDYCRQLRYYRRQLKYCRRQLKYYRRQLKYHRRQLMDCRWRGGHHLRGRHGRLVGGLPVGAGPGLLAAAGQLALAVLPLHFLLGARFLPLLPAAGRAVLQRRGLHSTQCRNISVRCQAALPAADAAPPNSTCFGAVLSVGLACRGDPPRSRV